MTSVSEQRIAVEARREVVDATGLDERPRHEAPSHFRGTASEDDGAAHELRRRRDEDAGLDRLRDGDPAAVAACVAGVASMAWKRVDGVEGVCSLDTRRWFGDRRVQEGSYAIAATRRSWYGTRIRYRRSR